MHINPGPTDELSFTSGTTVQQEKEPLDKSSYFSIVEISWNKKLKYRVAEISPLPTAPSSSKKSTRKREKQGLLIVLLK